MKKLLILILVTSAAAETIRIENQPLGSGTPGSTGFETSVQVDNDYLHAPQYITGYPTAATIWPRTLEVKCIKSEGVVCQGYSWLPSMGRGEYLFIKPVVVEAPALVVKTVEKLVYVEVPFVPAPKEPVKIIRKKIVRPPKLTCVPTK